MKRVRIQLFPAFLFLFIFIFLFSACGDSASVKEENLTTYQIKIPGVEKNYRFLYLTDTHMIIPDKNEDKKISDYAAKRLPVFAIEDTPASSDQFPEWIDYVNEQDFDGLLLGGDIIDFPSGANLQYLQSSLVKLEKPYVYTLGNHDWTYPWEYMTEKGKSEYLPLLSHYMENNSSIHTVDFEDLTIVAVDNSNNQINPAALEEYKKILAKDKPVILMLHVPLYSKSVLDKAAGDWKSGVILGGGIHGGIYPDSVSTEFLSLTTAKDSPVELVLAGHIHLADKSDIQGEKNIPQITGDAGYKGKATIIQISG
ncbi:MAG: hypothetical protein GX235_10540 [Clostridiales bacterium]|nr:hypothetical protein [Clostridiales bacterium]